LGRIRERTAARKPLPIPHGGPIRGMRARRRLREAQGARAFAFLRLSRSRRHYGQADTHATAVHQKACGGDVRPLVLLWVRCWTVALSSSAAAAGSRSAGTSRQPLSAGSGGGRVASAERSAAAGVWACGVRSRGAEQRRARTRRQRRPRVPPTRDRRASPNSSHCLVHAASAAVGDATADQRTAAHNTHDTHNRHCAAQLDQPPHPSPHPPARQISPNPNARSVHTRSVPSPRAATSVASMRGCLPLLNSARTLV